MDNATTASPEAQAKPTSTQEPKRGRRPRQQPEEIARYFLAKEGSSIDKPELGQEISSEGEALIKAFQSKSAVIYTLLTYKAEAEMQGGSPTLVKRPLRKS